MGAEVVSSVFLVNSSDARNKHYGTGTLIFLDSTASYFLTCAHVVAAVGGIEQLRIGNERAKLVSHRSQTQSAPDLSVLKVETRFDAPPLSIALQGDTGRTITIPGCRLYKKAEFIIRPLSGTLGAKLEIIGPDAAMRHPAWDLVIDGEFDLQPGYSGSPVIAAESGCVIGIASDSLDTGRKGIAVSTAALVEVWPVMPAELENTFAGAETVFSGSSKRDEAVVCVDADDLVPAGGAMALDSRFYIEKVADQKVIREIYRPRAMVIPEYCT